MKSAVPINKFGIQEKGGIPVVGSRYVADIFGKRHDNVLRDIENILKEPEGSKFNALKFEVVNAVGDNVHIDEVMKEFAIDNFTASSYKDSKGEQRTEYIMTEQGFSLLVMGFSGDKAKAFKILYINRFREMEKFIKNLSAAKMEFPIFTNTIMELHEEPKHYHFSNEIDMINRIVTGRSAKQIREEHGLQKGESIRPFLTNEQIAAVRMLQTADVGLMVAKLPFDARKKTLTDYHRNSISGKYLKAPCTKLLQA